MQLSCMYEIETQPGLWSDQRHYCQYKNLLPWCPWLVILLTTIDWYKCTVPACTNTDCKDLRSTGRSCIWMIVMAQHSTWKISGQWKYMKSGIIVSLNNTLYELIITSYEIIGLAVLARLTWQCMNVNRTYVVIISPSCCIAVLLYWNVLWADLIWI